VQFKKNEYNIKEKERERRLTLDKELKKPDKDNIELLKTIEGINPKYAKHVLAGNKLLMEFVKHMGGGIELLEQPVCRRCENPISWDMPDSKGNQRGYCFKCNIHTINPITTREYLLTEVSNLPKEHIEMLLKQAENKNKGDVLDV